MNTVENISNFEFISVTDINPSSLEISYIMTETIDKKLSIRKSIEKANLTSTEHSIVMYRFFNGYSLAETGKRLLNTKTKCLGVTQERVRQMEAKLLRKLRTYIRSEAC